MKVRNIFYIVFCVLVFQENSVFSQVYKPLLDDFNEWHITSCNFGCIQDKYYTDGDTIINGTSFKILDGYHYISRTFLLREDVTEQKVYLTFIDPFTGPREWLLYDFSLQVNDVINVFNPVSPFPLNSGDFQLDSIIPRTLIDGNNYDHFYLHALDTVQSGGVKNVVWIEGVGSTSLINAPGGEADVNGPGKLSCFFKNGNLHYSQMDSVATCDPIYFPNSINETTSFEIEVYPTLTHSEINIQSEYEISEIKIFDLNGKLIKRFKVGNEKTTMLNVEELNEGIYILDIQLSNLHHKKVKFLKMN
jgi:hypothetical protein